MTASKKGIIISLIISFVFFFIALLTLSDYGISWDEPIHFHRGQGYLHYFLTGEKEFTNVSGKQSYYQSSSLPASYFFEKDSGHPPLNGILASLTNYIFYQQLGIMGDIESHHLFNTLVSSLLVFIVTLFAYETFGLFAAIIAGLSLGLYPLFFGESRFNIKDPAEAAFFGLTIYAFWKAINNWSWKWLLLSAVWFGLGLGTKFNILFLPFILIPWAIYKVIFIDRKFKFNKSFIIALLFSPLIVLAIFIGSWPFLWADPINNFLEIFGYYKQIGTGFNHQTTEFYLPLGFNSYSLLWIIYTTPPYLLFLSAIGIIASLLSFKRKDGATMLWLLWLIIPIARVVLPGTSIYGGVRQIMEYIPALALLSGLGAVTLFSLIKNYLPQLNPQLLRIVLLIGFVQISIVLIKIHPHQNVYFNSLIGGLSGAKEKNIPSWGNSFGNAYYPAIQWINKNAEPNSVVALVQGTALNIPRFWFIEGIGFSNQAWSGSLRKGEYMLELTHQSPVRAYPYAWDYIERVLDPVYEVKVDGVAIAKVWKNDLKNSKPQFQKPEKIILSKIIIDASAKSLVINLPSINYITRIELEYPAENCTKPSGAVSVSEDGTNFITEPDPYPNEFVTEPIKKPNTIYQYFAVPKAKIIKFTDNSQNSCLLKYTNIEVRGF